jgi:hypothetical protein
MMVLNLEKYAFPGYGSAIGFCDLIVYTAEEIAIATERADNPGASVTNQAAILATQIVRNFELDPVKFIFIEHYDARSYGDPNEKERFALVTFTWNKAAERYENASFVHIDRDYVRTVIPNFNNGPAPVPPTVKPRRPGPPPAPAT